MNPIAKCCGYYCSCILVVSFFFFGILIALIQQRNWWIIREFAHDTDSKIEAITLVMITNGLCLFLCVGCTVYGTMQEKKELLRLERLEEEQENELKIH
jgi:hypothetical protein